MTEFRAFELRATSSGELEGRVVANGQPSLIGGVFNETFAAGSLRYSDLLVNVQHRRDRPLARLGTGLTLTDSPTELRATVVLPDTADGRDVRTLIDSNVLTGFSVEVQVREDDWPQSDQRIVRSADLVGLGIVDSPAHTSSLIAEVRARIEAAAKPHRRYWL